MVGINPNGALSVIGGIGENKIWGFMYYSVSLWELKSVTTTKKTLEYTVQTNRNKDLSLASGELQFVGAYTEVTTNKNVSVNYF